MLNYSLISNSLPKQALVERRIKSDPTDQRANQADTLSLCNEIVNVNSVSSNDIIKEDAPLIQSDFDAMRKPSNASIVYTSNQVFTAKARTPARYNTMPISDKSGRRSMDTPQYQKLRPKTSIRSGQNFQKKKLTAVCSGPGGASGINTPVKGFATDGSELVLLKRRSSM